MPSKYQIKRQNRDRRGGHKNTVLEKEYAGLHLKNPDIGAYPVQERAHIKREGKRLVRRQHKKALAEAVVNYQEDLLVHCSELQEELEELDRYYEDQQYRDFIDGVEDYDTYANPCDPYYDPYDPCCDSFGPLDDDFVIRSWDRQPELPDRVTVSKHDAGKTIGQLLREVGLGYLLEPK